MRAILAIIASAAVAALVLVSATVEGIAVEGSAVAKVRYWCCLTDVPRVWARRF